MQWKNYNFIYFQENRLKKREMRFGMAWARFRPDVIFIL